MTRSLPPVPTTARYVLHALFSHVNAPLTRSCLQVFIWQVPEDFSLHTDADEPTDVSPVAKLSGHTRYATINAVAVAY